MCANFICMKKRFCSGSAESLFLRRRVRRRRRRAKGWAARPVPECPLAEPKGGQAGPSPSVQSVVCRVPWPPQGIEARLRPRPHDGRPKTSRCDCALAPMAARPLSVNFQSVSILAQVVRVRSPMKRGHEGHDSNEDKEKAMKAMKPDKAMKAKEEEKAMKADNGHGGHGGHGGHVIEGHGGHEGHEGEKKTKASEHNDGGGGEEAIEFPWVCFKNCACATCVLYPPPPLPPPPLHDTFNDPTDDWEQLLLM